MKYLINLIPEKEQNISDKIIFFSFHYLRYILVITQFVAICVFFYRFKVDQEIVDLRDVLKQKRIIVESTKNMLQEVNRLDAKMLIIKRTLAKQESVKDIYTYIFRKIQSPIQIDKLLIDGEQIEIQGFSVDILAIQNTFQSFRTDKRFKSSELTSIVKEGSEYVFTLKLKI